MHIVQGVPELVDLYGKATRTQQLDIYSQVVEGGARVLDLRPVRYSPGTRRSPVAAGYYTGHWSSILDSKFLWAGLVGQSLPELCDDLRRALAELGPKETLVVTVTHGVYLVDGGGYFPLTPEQQSEIITALLAACSGHLFTAADGATVNFFDLTPNDLAAHTDASTVFFVLQDGTFDECGRGQSDGCFTASSLRTHSTWAGANTDNEETFFADVEHQLRTYDGSAGPLELSWALTWQIQHPWGDLQRFAAELNPQLPVRLDKWSGIIGRSTPSWPVSIGWNFIRAVNGPGGTTDPTFAACLRLNGLPV